MTDKTIKDVISCAVNLSIVGIVLLFTTLQALKFMVIGHYVSSAVFVLGALCLTIFFFIAVIDFAEKEAADVLEGMKNKFLRGVTMIAIAFVILLPSAYTLFLSDLIKI